MQFREVEAEVRYLSASDGGRKHPVFSGYRGQFHYVDDPDVHDAQQLFPDLAGAVPPGTAVRVVLQFPADVWDRIHAHRISVGTKFEVREGRRLVGRGVITKV